MNNRTLRDLFHRVKQVLPDEQDVTTFPPEFTVGEAFAEMNKRNISQVPIVENNEVLGVFSYRSFAEGMRKLPTKERDPLSLPVEVFLETISFANITDELEKLLDEFDAKDSVLVGSEERLQGIITSVDVLRYFYHVANPYVMLREIELAIRELIRASAGSETLKDCFVKIIGKHYTSLKRNVPERLEDLTFNDYVMILKYKGTWDMFRSAFGGTSNTVYAKLEPLASLRNDIFHFRRDITAEEYDVLRDCRDWLLTRIRKVEASRGPIKND